MAYQYGCRPNRDPTRWGGAGAPSQVFCAARSWRRGNSLAPSMFDPLGVERPQGAEPKNKTICQRQMVLFLSCVGRKDTGFFVVRKERNVCKGSHSQIFLAFQFLRRISLHSKHAPKRMRNHLHYRVILW